MPGGCLHRTILENLQYPSNPGSQKTFFELTHNFSFKVLEIFQKPTRKIFFLKKYFLEKRRLTAFNASRRWSQYKKQKKLEILAENGSGKNGYLKVCIFNRIGGWSSFVSWHLFLGG